MNPQEVAGELRRLAEQRRTDAESDAVQKRWYWVHRYRGMAYAYEDAAMLVERLSPTAEPSSSETGMEEKR